MSVPLLALITSGTITALLSQSAQAPEQWGVFDDTGNPALGNFDSVLEFSYSRRYDISTYYVQAGSFATYNKVIQPYEIELRFTASGTQDSRGAFLKRLEDLCASVALFSVVTPELTYASCNPTHFDVHRKGGQGAFWLSDVSLYLVEILESTPQYTTTAVNLPNAQESASQPTSNVGTAYPYQPTGILQNAGNSAIGSVVPGTL